MMTRLMLIMCTGLSLLALLFLAGCNSTSYFGDATPNMEATRYQYARTHPSEDFNSAILAGKIKEGMNRHQVLVSWGRPSSIGEGDQPNIDQVWAYQETDPSRGPCTYVLRFNEGSLEDIDVVRGLFFVTTINVSDEPLTEEVLSSAQAKRK